MRRFPAVAVAAIGAFVLAGAGCTKESARAAGRLTVDGRAEVVEGNGERTSVTRDRTLQSGDQVRVEEGTARLGLGGGRQLELRAGSAVRLAVGAATTGGQTELRGELLSGDALVLTTGDAATVVVGSTTVRVQGAARISRGLAVVTAVYEGAAGVESAGRSASVPALRQVTVPAPGLPSRASPLLASPANPWDQRYLGDAIDLGNQLVARSKGFSAQLGPNEGTTVGFYRELLPELDSQPFDASFLDSQRPPGETLVGAAITLASSRDTFAARWSSVFSFHADGAPWGLVAMEQGAARSAVLSLVDEAIARRAGPPQQAAPPGPSPTTSPPRVVVPVPTTSAATTPPATAAPATRPPATIPPATNPPTTAPTGGGVPGADRGPVDLGVPLVDDTLNALIDALSGLLSSLGK